MKKNHQNHSFGLKKDQFTFTSIFKLSAIVELILMDHNLNPKKNILLFFSNFIIIDLANNEKN